MLTIDIDGDDQVERGRDDPVKGESLQARFEAMRQRRIEAQKRVTAAEQAQRKPRRSKAERERLRAKFVKQVRSYIGVPYSKKASGVDAPLYLDCCNLVRRCLLDLKDDFGFKVGHWNQAYQYDTLPVALSAEQLRPGDLIFWSATYNDPLKKPRRHDMVHVEVFVGGASGEATIGSRSTDPHAPKAVALHESYRSYAAHCTASHGFTTYFRSIDTWLDGVCVSHCKECSWAERPTARLPAGGGGGGGAPLTKKYSIFEQPGDAARAQGAGAREAGNEENAADNGAVWSCFLPPAPCVECETAPAPWPAPEVR